MSQSPAMTSFSSQNDSQPSPPVQPASPSVTLDLLGRAIRAVEPGAVLVGARFLRRVIRAHCHLPTLAWRVPHRKSYVIARRDLLEIAEADELDFSPPTEAADPVMLLERPALEDLVATNPEELLTQCWRLLFHCRVHVAMDERARGRHFSPLALTRRIHRLGTVAFEEVRGVLQHDDLLLPPRDDLTAYVEFAAVFLELYYFAPSSLPLYFPAIEDAGSAFGLLGEDLDADALLKATRPPGAADPVDRFSVDEFQQIAVEEEESEAEPTSTARQPSESRYRRLMLRAENAAAAGNLVRSAILRAQARRSAPRRFVAKVRSGVVADVHRLLQRLQLALDLDEAQMHPCEEPLVALVQEAAGGTWTVEARLLYDLQKVCLDHERGVYAVDVVEWALSRGRRPIKRPLPSQRDVSMAKHLRSALGRLTRAGISDPQRQALLQSLRAAGQRVDQRIRAQFRPLIAQALANVGLRPRSLPERVACRKLSEELLDLIVERGFAKMGDLRDALSRNNLKLPDFAGPADLLHGDPLLRADRQLSISLDGVYRRGEFYLRWMQQLSSLAFGTRVGRWLTRFAAVPFGGAYLVLAGIQHLADLVPHREFEIRTYPAIALMGLFFLGLMHLTRFRRFVWQATKAVGRGARLLLFELPRWAVGLPAVQAVLRSRAFTATLRVVVKPAAMTILLWWLIPVPHATWQSSPQSFLALFAVINLVMNSRLGRSVEELLLDWALQTWRWFGLRVIAGLFWAVIDLFKALLEYTERLLYTVDEWLRFRSGESRAALAGKAVLSVVWFFVTYVVRFCITLLIEPQVNPIKHFPVVTVSHKLLLPFIPHLGAVLALTMEKGLAYTVAGTIIAGIPGVFGFLVWELKENWRLYAANRPAELRPVPIGHHGETMLRLLKPGFHSGTLPKRFAKLRRAERAARASGNWQAVRNHRLALQKVEADIGHFVQRELLALLEETGLWREELACEIDVRSGTNRVCAALRCDGSDEAAIQLTFAYKSGWLVADVQQKGSELFSGTQATVGQVLPAQNSSDPFLFSGDPEALRRQALHTAILGLLKLSGSDAVRQQVESLLPQTVAAYDFIPNALVVWPDASLETEVRYSLRDSNRLTPEVVSGPTLCAAPRLDRSQLMLRQLHLSWSDWLDCWAGFAAEAKTESQGCPS